MLYYPVTAHSLPLFHLILYDLLCLMRWCCFAPALFYGAAHGAFSKRQFFAALVMLPAYTSAESITHAYASDAAGLPVVPYFFAVTTMLASALTPIPVAAYLYWWWM